MRYTRTPYTDLLWSPHLETFDCSKDEKHPTTFDTKRIFETLSESVLFFSKEYSSSEMRPRIGFLKSFPGDCLGALEDFHVEPSRGSPSPSNGHLN